MASRYLSDRAFEDEVRRVADALFDLSPGDTKPEIFSKGSRRVEIDGVARSRHVVHLLMATTSTKLEKVKEDVEKLGIAGESEEHSGNASKKWMVLEKAPEGPHVTYAKGKGVTLLTLQELRERYFDGRKYLAKRKNSAFGSARDPETDSAVVAEDEFIEPPLVDLETGRPTTLSEVVERLNSGAAVVLVGPFGSGKSLSLREVWFALRKPYLAGSMEFVPVAVNLREHWGAEFADEILRRHARSIAFEPEADLITAWRAGMLTLLVDGFDEMTAQGVTSISAQHMMRQIRQKALVGVRDLVAKSPRDAGILIAGRDHYFDDRSEMEHALGLQSRPFSRVRVEEFDEARAEEYLRKKGANTGLPDWLPRKALLLGYLARRGLLQDVLSINGEQGQARAWHAFVDLICRREAEHDRAAMDCETVRRVLEHLAVQVRSTPSGVGPISASMLAQAYTSVTGQVAGDAVLMQLQRLPGLTERDAEPGSRSFVDQDFLEALQGSATARQLTEGAARSNRQRFNVAPVDDHNWFEPLGSLASGVAAVQLLAAGWTLEGLVPFIRQYSSSQYGADLLHIAFAWATEVGTPLDMRGIELSGVHLGCVDLEELAVKGLRLSDAIIDQLLVGALANESDLAISNSQISEVAGVGSREHFPPTLQLVGRVDVDRYDTLRTTNAIVSLRVDDRVKALLSALKKLFRQRGAGRVVGAFHRGLPPQVEQHVDAVLQLLTQAGFAWRLKDTYHPVRKETRRAHEMLDNPTASADPVIERARTL